jgi:hypothetical protein
MLNHTYIHAESQHVMCKQDNNITCMHANIRTYTHATHTYNAAVPSVLRVACMHTYIRIFRRTAVSVSYDCSIHTYIHVTACCSAGCHAMAAYVHTHIYISLHTHTHIPLSAGYHAMVAYMHTHIYISTHIHTHIPLSAGYHAMVVTIKLLKRHMMTRKQ